MDGRSYIAIIAVGLIFAMGATDAYGQSVSVSLDRDKYTVPSSPDTTDTDVKILVTINDLGMNLDNDGSDSIELNIGNSTTGPLKISVSRGSDTVIIATAGGAGSGGSILTIGTEPGENQYDYGSIDEESTEGIFEFVLRVLYTDGPTSDQCPSIDSYKSPSGPAGDSSKRFADINGNTPDGDFCILNGDTITAEYTYLDADVQKTVSDSARFTLTDAELKTDKEVYDIGDDIVLELTDSDHDLADYNEAFGLDNMIWDSSAATLELQDGNWVFNAFGAEGINSYFYETGDSTGIFEATIRIPSELNGTALSPGELVTITHTDLNPSSANYVGESNKTSSVTIRISDTAVDSGDSTVTNATGTITPDPPVTNATGTITPDPPVTNATGTITPDPPVTRTVDSSNWVNGKVEWTESRYNAETETATLQVTDSDQNTNTNSPDSFGVNVRSDTDSAGIAITVTETGDATGIFKGDVSFTLTDRSTDGTLLVSSGDTITGEYVDHTPEAPDTAKDRPSVTKTAAINVINVEEPDPNISIKLDKETYTWTDRVRVQITSSEHNTDERSRDEIGGTENPVRVATRGGHIDLYKLKETDLNTGVFAGELVLAGFKHDADGNSSTGSGGNDVPDSDARGSGPDKGVLPADNEDAVSVTFEYAEGKVITANSAIQWNEGTVSWIGSNFTTAGNGTFQVIDPDMNLDPSSADSFEVRVRPESKSWTNLTVTETGEETGIFEVLVFFMTDDSSDNTLEVSLGDKVTGQYMDHTLPEPYVITKGIEISDTMEITAPIDTNSTDSNSTNTDSATTNSTGTNSTNIVADKAESSAEKPKDDTKPKTKPSDAKPKDTKPSDDDKPKDARPADDAKPKDKEPASDSKLKADSKPTVDPKPKMDPKPTDGPDKPGCGPGTELVDGTCQAVRSPVSFVDWLFSWFR